MSIIESDPESLNLNHSIPSFSPEKFVEPSLDSHHEHHCYCEHGQTSPSAYPTTSRHDVWLKRLIFPATVTMLATLLAPVALFAWNQVDWASSPDEHLVRRDTYAGIHVSPKMHRVLKIAFPCVIVVIVMFLVASLVSWRICYNRRKRMAKQINEKHEQWATTQSNESHKTREVLASYGYSPKFHTPKESKVERHGRPTQVPRSRKCILCCC